MPATKQATSRTNAMAAMIPTPVQMTAVKSPIQSEV